MKEDMPSFTKLYKRRNSQCVAGDTPRTLKGCLRKSLPHGCKAVSLDESSLAARYSLGKNYQEVAKTLQSILTSENSIIDHTEGRKAFFAGYLSSWTPAELVKGLELFLADQQDISKCSERLALHQNLASNEVQKGFSAL